MESATRMREGDRSQIVEGDTQASDIMCLACEQYRDGRGGTIWCLEYTLEGRGWDCVPFGCDDIEVSLPYPL